MANTIIPTSDQFADFFRHNHPEKFEEEMLMLHFFSPQHTLTTGTFASAMEWKNLNAINLKYGKFAGETAEGMSFALPSPKFKVSFFVDFNMPESGKDDGHWQWIMRPELAEAIEKLGWATEGAKEKYESKLRWAELMTS